MNIYNKKEELKRASIILQNEALSCENFYKCLKIRSKQDKVYKKYKFFNEYLKAREKIK